MIRALPNLVSLTRLFLAPYILSEIRNQHYDWALLWCLVAGVTDALDGFLARRLHAESRLGAYLDPIGDKLLLSGTFLVLWLNGVTPRWLTALVFGRDLLILLFAAGAMLFTRIRDFAPTLWGKVSTTIQILAALIFLVAQTGWGSAAGWLISPAVFAVALGTGWSAVHYVWTGLQIVRGHRRLG